MQRILSVIFIGVFSIFTAYSQGFNSPNTQSGFFHDTLSFDAPQDSITQADSQPSDWEDDSVIIYKFKRESQVNIPIDTTLEHLQKAIRSEAFGWANLGNYNSAGFDLLFAPKEFKSKSGRNHGLYAPYLIGQNDIFFYETSLPYTDFGFYAIGQNQQEVSLFHTQNVKPFWNISLNLKGNSSDGDFKRQKTQLFSGNINSHYKSPNQKFNNYTSLIYNNNKQNENGGILSYDYLSNGAFNDRQRIPTTIGEESNMGLENSPITHRDREFLFSMLNTYSLGVTDTIYTEDSTSLSLSYTPRLILSHELLWTNYQSLYEDKRPDPSFYSHLVNLPNLSFNDSVYSKRNWQVLDNTFSLSGNFGKGSQQFSFKAGLGMQYQYHKSYSDVGSALKNNLWGSYVLGAIKKEGRSIQDWDIHFNGKLFYTGEEAGNFELKGFLQKGVKDWAILSIHAQQNLQSPAWYQQKNIFNLFEKDNPPLSKESLTQIGGSLFIPKLKLKLFTDQILIDQMITLGADLNYHNHNELVYISQWGAEHQLSLGHFYLNSQINYQEINEHAPIALPKILWKESIGLSAPIFKKALLINTSVDIILYTPFKQASYVPLMNDFIFNHGTTSDAYPIINYHLNFKVKGFRGFVSVHHLQQLWHINQSFVDFYPYRNTYFIFGFNWRLLK